MTIADTEGGAAEKDASVEDLIEQSPLLITQARVEWGRQHAK